MYKYYVYIFSLAQQQMTHGPPQVRNPEVLQQFDAVIRTCPRKMYDLYFFSWPGTKWPMTQTWPGAQRLVNCALKKETIFYYIFKYLFLCTGSTCWTYTVVFVLLQYYWTLCLLPTVAGHVTAKCMFTFLQPVSDRNQVSPAADSTAACSEWLT